MATNRYMGTIWCGACTVASVLRSTVTAILYLFRLICYLEMKLVFGMKFKRPLISGLLPGLGYGFALFLYKSYGNVRNCLEAFCNIFGKSWFSLIIFLWMVDTPLLSHSTPSINTFHHLVVSRKKYPKHLDLGIYQWVSKKNPSFCFSLFHGKRTIYDHHRTASLA